jgi:hypothetical protein
MMKLKGFRYIGGYCLLSKACTRLAKEGKLFLFWWPASGVEGKTWKSFLRTSEVERLRKHQLSG